jgi:hypothetical protein
VRPALGFASNASLDFNNRQKYVSYALGICITLKEQGTAPAATQTANNANLPLGGAAYAILGISPWGRNAKSAPTEPRLWATDPANLAASSVPAVTLTEIAFPAKQVPHYSWEHAPLVLLVHTTQRAKVPVWIARICVRIATILQDHALLANLSTASTGQISASPAEEDNLPTSQP